MQIVRKNGSDNYFRGGGRERGGGAGEDRNTIHKHEGYGTSVLPVSVSIYTLLWHLVWFGRGLNGVRTTVMRECDLSRKGC